MQRVSLQDDFASNNIANAAVTSVPQQADPLAETGYRIAIGDGSVIVRRARKQHHCNGGHDGSKHTRCCSPISVGEIYIEYVGETSPYQSGNRYHVICARQQGLVQPVSEFLRTQGVNL